MAIRSWIRSALLRTANHPTRRPIGRTRIAVVPLEDRRVPATFTVLNTLDDGSTGSFRWAVGQANTTAGADSINFDSTAFAAEKTIVLSKGEVIFSDASITTVTGPATGLTLDGGSNNHRVFQVPSGKAAAFSGLVITGGSLINNTDAGGFYNAGTVTLTNCTVGGNNAVN